MLDPFADELMRSQTSLVVLGCSATKCDVLGSVPAVHLYDGPVYRVLRSYLRSRKWPDKLSVSVLSAKYGLIGGLAPIEVYDQRMTASRADSMRNEVSTNLERLAEAHESVHLVLGADYMRAIDRTRIAAKADLHEAGGPIGLKLHHFSRLLSDFHSPSRSDNIPERRHRRPLYFLPDWDDFLDVGFDFEQDKFSATTRADRVEAHSIEIMRPRRLCDGVLVSLAQHMGGGKGFLRRLPPADPDLLRPRSVRTHFGLMADQWAFGDCGAFSYSGQRDPAVSVEQAVAMYDLYDFDLGASVDHIPLEEIVEEDGTRSALSEYERRRRVRVTQENAASFIRLTRQRGCRFIPVGVIQSLTSKGYAGQIPQYIDMGYTHIALGGLVPQSDEDIRAIIESIAETTKGLREPPWIHLLGVFRPKLQDLFRSAGIASFDSATYFRKAWLRSDQNYLATDGKWFAAVRVPPSGDARTMQRLRRTGLSASSIKRLEGTALSALRKFDAGLIGIRKCLDAVLAYDELLNRGGPNNDALRRQYQRTLEDRPWTKCSCNMCRKIGIDVVMFRGYNRNKRRGAHNTLQLFRALHDS